MKEVARNLKFYLAKKKKKVREVLGQLEITTKKTKSKNGKVEVKKERRERKKKPEERQKFLKEERKQEGKKEWREGGKKEGNIEESLLY